MTVTLGIIHTSPATLDLFPGLIRAQVPDVRIVNILDDSILPELRDNGGRLEAVLPRWAGYCRAAKDQGARLLFNACSSIGALGAVVAPQIGIPIVRVDAAMAREAVRRGRRVGVIATLPTTLHPTTALVEETAQAEGSAVEVEAVLVDGAYDALMAGDREEHDQRVADALGALVARSDVVVLAQASMARVVPALAEGERSKVLASPPFAVADVIAALRRIGWPATPTPASFRAPAPSGRSTARSAPPRSSP